MGEQNSICHTQDWDTIAVLAQELKLEEERVGQGRRAAYYGSSPVQFKSWTCSPILFT